jgi:hypothetical protein
MQLGQREVQAELLVQLAVLAIRAEQIIRISLIYPSDCGDVQVALFRIVPLLNSVHRHVCYFAFLLHSIQI